MIVDGSWATILGSNLARATRIWREADIVGVDLPKILDDVSVTFNGQLAAVYFVSPTQLNVQVLETEKIGPVVGVTTATGTSNTFMANVGRNGGSVRVLSGRRQISGGPHSPRKRGRGLPRALGAFRKFVGDAPAFTLWLCLRAEESAVLAFW